MSFKVLAWAQSFKTGSPSTKAVLMAIASIVNDDGEGFPSQQRIADDSELSIRSVKRAMDELEKGGLLTRERRYREGGYRTSDAIKINTSLKILGATESGDRVSGDTVSNLRCHSGLAEPVIEPVSTKPIAREVEKSPPVAKRGTRIPDDFLPDHSCHVLADELLLTSSQCQTALDNFLDYWRAVPGAKGLKLDWQATFRNWLRRYSEQIKPKGKAHGPRNSPNTISDGFAKVDAVLDEINRREQAASAGRGEANLVSLPGLRQSAA